MIPDYWFGALVVTWMIDLIFGLEYAVLHFGVALMMSGICQKAWGKDE